MAQEWTGESKGTSLGFKIFAFLIKHFGIKSAYIVLFFVATYYFLFSPKAFGYQFNYFKNILGFSFLKAVFSIYKNYFVFGQTLIDRYAIPMGLEDAFTFNFFQSEIIRETQNKGNGGILISAHIGNFEVTGHFLNERLDNPMNLVTLETGSDQLEQFMEEQIKANRIKLIKIVPGSLSHMIEISAAVRRNELVTFTGDRYISGKTYTANFLGKPAKFPAGVFDIASKLKVPVLFVFAMKDSATHYEFSCHTASEVGLKPEEILAEYISTVETKLKQYPEQWFNYFPFWEESKKP
ncbi:MAG: lipid A biosynthesis acyltransferase [Salibacteraceae bacterium]